MVSVSFQFKFQNSHILSIMNHKAGFPVTSSIMASIIGGIYLVILMCGFLVNITGANHHHHHPQQLIKFEDHRGRDSRDSQNESRNVYPEVIRLRVRRQGGGGGGGGWGNPYLGPVYTYVKTDKHANFKWGVRHLVGGQHGWQGR